VTPALAGRPLIGAALFAWVIGSGALAADGLRYGLAVSGPDGGILVQMEGPDFCLHWAHSVTGGAVADCFEIRAGVLVLTRSYLHDFAAGLGHIPGRGQQRAAAQGGYWIDGIDEPVPGNALVLRVGAPHVGHRIIANGHEANLSALAAGTRVMLRPHPIAPSDD